MITEGIYGAGKFGAGDRRFVAIKRSIREREQAAKVARAWNVPIGELRSPTRRRAPVAQARQVAMYLTHVIYGFSLSAVGRHFGRDRTTAAHACRMVEDRRDDENFDMLLDRLEHALRRAGDRGVTQ
jgi:chromosomal replication initiation ATPase DnaA